jgi:hypothetical protein
MNTEVMNWLIDQLTLSTGEGLPSEDELIRMRNRLLLRSEECRRSAAEPGEEAGAKTFLIEAAFLTSLAAMYQMDIRENQDAYEAVFKELVTVIRAAGAETLADSHQQRRGMEYRIRRLEKAANEVINTVTRVAPDEAEDSINKLARVLAEEWK